MQAVQLQQTYKIGQEAWSEALSNLNLEYGEAVFKSWFSHLTFQEMRDNIMIITAPSRFIREWIQTNYLKAIQKHVFSINPTIKVIDLRIKPNRAKTAKDDPSNDNLTEANEKCDVLSYNLDPRFTFDNFVCGSSNKVAYETCRAIANNMQLAAANNILFLHSHVGMGKTHLLQAIAAHIKQSDTARKVAYLSAEKFMHLYIKSVKANDTLTFKEKFRNTDILIIDDIQFICGKTSTQQEFMNILTALSDSNRKVVVSCDSSPYSLNLDGKNKSRLAGGLVVEIRSADYELRLQILEAKCRQLNVKPSDEVMELIAKSISSNVRELEAALHKVITHSSISNSPITLEFTKDVLRDNISAHNQDISVESIIDTVAAYYNIKATDILSKSRAAVFVTPRQICALLAKQLTTKSLQDIGQKLGGRDHATVIYSIKKLEDRTETDKNLAYDIAKIMEIFSR